MNTLTVTRFEGEAASVNSWILANNSHLVIVDALRDEAEASRLADVVAATGKIPFAVFVTHGHADHYIGLRTLKERFPALRILVASEAIKSDIIGFSQWMDSMGWLDGMPRMKVRSAKNQDGFDYDCLIEVWREPTFELPGGGKVEIRADYPAVEAAHMTTLFVPEINALFSADLVYNTVHPWLGAGVTREAASNWLQVLADIKARFAGNAPMIHPGHGASGGQELIERMQVYLGDFLAAAYGAASNQAMTDRLVQLYPRHRQADFLLAYSVANFGPDTRVAA
jgi:glyoxylase-like metal-dependent hydrolase (beta-lactamase superfamily II)